MISIFFFFHYILFATPQKAKQITTVQQKQKYNNTKNKNNVKKTISKKKKTIKRKYKGFALRMSGFNIYNAIEEYNPLVKGLIQARYTYGDFRNANKTIFIPQISNNEYIKIKYYIIPAPKQDKIQQIELFLLDNEVFIINIIVGSIPEKHKQKFDMIKQYLIKNYGPYNPPSYNIWESSYNNIMSIFHALPTILEWKDKDTILCLIDAGDYGIFVRYIDRKIFNSYKDDYKHFIKQKQLNKNTDWDF